MFEAFVQYLINNNVPEYTILVLLYIPVVATIVTFARYIIGWTSLNIYSTILLTFALLELAHVEAGSFDIQRGLWYGALITFFISGIAYVIQNFAGSWRIHYLAKVSIITAVVTMSVFAMLYVATELQAANFMRLDPSAFLIMILMLDLFVRSYIRKGQKKALNIIAHTIGMAFVIFVLMAQPAVRTTMLKYPEIIFYTILVNIFLGQSRGLRLSEYIRFKNIKQYNDSERDTEQK
jgi:hypothetical protein